MRRFSAILFCLFLSACAPPEFSAPPPAAAVRLDADHPRLRAAAEQALRRVGVEISRDISAPVMRVRENSGEEVESVGADGAPNFYAVRYELVYQLGENPARRVSESRIVDHEESRYLAERRRRRAVVDDLRRRALGEMIYRLRKRPEDFSNPPAKSNADSGASKP